MSGDHISAPEINYLDLSGEPTTPTSDVESFITLALNEPTLALLALNHYGRYGNSADSIRYEPPAQPTAKTTESQQSNQAAVVVSTEAKLVTETNLGPDKLDERVRAAAGVVSILFSGRGDLDLQFDTASQEALEADKDYAKILSAGRAKRDKRGQADPRGIVGEARSFPIRYMLERIRQYNDQQRIGLRETA